MNAYCPQCGRGLHNVMVSGQGSCRQHGVVNAEFEDPTMVVDADRGTVLGFYVGTDTDTGDISYRAQDGTVAFEPRMYVDVIRSSEIEQGEW